MTNRNKLIITAAILLSLNGATTLAQTTDWPTFGFDGQRTGYNPQEVILSQQTVPSLQLQWATNLGAPMTAQPVEATGLLYAATWAGMIYAIDPLSGSIVWSKQLGATQTSCNDSAVFGIIGTPTIDTSNGRVFVVSGDDLLHALDPGTGNELTSYPLQLLGPANAAPRTFVYGSPTYNPDNNSLYLATASVCDNPPYHGQVMRVDVTPGAVPRVLRRWFVDGNSGPDGGGGIWGPGGAAIHHKAVFVATGNALAYPENQFYGDHVVRLGLDLGVEAANSPNDLGNQANDSDFGSTPLLYHPPGCPPLLAVLNKNGSLYVYNRNAIGNGPTQELFITAPATASFIGDAAYDPNLNHVYVTSNADDGVGVFFHGIVALSVQSDCTLALAWQQPIGPNDGGVNSPPITANGVVYAPTGDGSAVFAFDGASGQYLWDSGAVAQGGVLTAPMVVNGQLFIADFSGNLSAFGLPTSIPR
jgi:outer membrane protein assembly factor BamB